MGATCTRQTASMPRCSVPFTKVVRGKGALRELGQSDHCNLVMAYHIYCQPGDGHGWLNDKICLFSENVWGPWGAADQSFCCGVVFGWYEQHATLT